MLTMTKIDIFSGFLGAGKTTLIKKLIKEALADEKVVLIENEFGEIGIDSGFLKDAGIEITEMNSGCICCSLVGDFAEALKKVLTELSPDRILIEPSGVGKLSDVIKAVKTAESDEVKLNSFTTVVDAKKCKMYMKNFGEFYNDQIENSACIVLSHTKDADNKKIAQAVDLIREKNSTATIVTTDWDELDGKVILETMEGARSLEKDIKNFEHEDEHCNCRHHHHEHHHEEHCECEHNHEHHHDEHCECGHHHEHHHDGHCDCNDEHHNQHHGEQCECGHHHEHHHDEHCGCGHHHEHQHNHHADEVFESWGIETTTKYSKDYIENALSQLENNEKYGIILRAKGIVAEKSGKWIHFDYIPEKADVRFGGADITGRICVIGSKINKSGIEQLFTTENH